MSFQVRQPLLVAPFRQTTTTTFVAPQSSFAQGAQSVFSPQQCPPPQCNPQQQQQLLQLTMLLLNAVMMLLMNQMGGGGNPLFGGDSGFSPSFSGGPLLGAGSNPNRLPFIPRFPGVPRHFQYSPYGFGPNAAGATQHGNPFNAPFFNGPTIPPGGSGASPQLINKLNQKFSRGVLAGQGEMIADAAIKEGIDPAFFAAVVGHETGWGTSKMIRQKNNPGGIFRNGSYASFPNLYSGLRYTASNLRRNYFNKGITSIGAIGNKYAPVGAANDPRGLNNQWVSSVTRFYNELRA